MKIKDLASTVSEEVATKLDDEGYKFDPATILIIITVISKIIEYWDLCGVDPERATKMANSPSLIEKLVLRRAAITTLGRAEFRKSGGAIMEALEEHGKTLNTTDMQELFADYESQDL